MRQLHISNYLKLSQVISSYLKLSSYQRDSKIERGVSMCQQKNITPGDKRVNQLSSYQGVN